MRFAWMFVFSSLIVLVAQAQVPRFFDVPDMSKLSSDEATKIEIDRIEKLAPSKSAALNQEALSEARSATQSLRNFPDRISELEKISPDISKKRISDAMTQMSKSIATCARKAIAENQLVIQRQFDQFSRARQFGFRGGPNEQLIINTAIKQRLI